MTPDKQLESYAQSQWQSVEPPFQFTHDAPSSWLNHRESLTRRLKQHCDCFEVQVLNERIESLDDNEQNLLNAGIGDQFWVREVYLFGDGKPWVFARSVMPVDKKSSELSQIQKLNQKPLGEMLFSNPNLQIKARLVAQFSPTQRLNPSSNSTATSLWGRRTLFDLGHYPLIVTEIFLPDSPAYQ